MCISYKGSKECLIKMKDGRLIINYLAKSRPPLPLHSPPIIIPHFVPQPLMCNCVRSTTAIIRNEMLSQEFGNSLCVSKLNSLNSTEALV